MSDAVMHVLSIEDNPKEAQLICEMLAEASGIGWDLPYFEVVQVDRLTDGLAYLASAADPSTPVDVVLTDLDLPDSRAAETVDRIRAQAPGVPVVVLTGRDDVELARRAVRVGTQDYLFKAEATGSLLAHSLIYAIERQRAHDTLEARVKARTQDLKEANESLRAEIDERARVEAQLRFHAQLLDSVREAVFATDLTGRVIYWGKGAEALYGYRAEEMLGRPVESLITGSPDEDEERERFRYVRETGVWRGEHRQRRKDGTTFWTDASISRVVGEDGTSTGMIGIYRDITIRKRIESQREAAILELQRTTDLLRLAEAMAHLGSWEINLETDETRWSDEFFRICGYEPGAFTPTTEHGVACIHPDDRDIAEAALQGLIEGEEAYNIEKRIVRPDGSVRYVHARGEIIQEGPNGARKIVGTLQDVTERKRVEAQLRRSEERLSRAEEVAHLGGWEMDIATGKSEWSDEFFRICGFEPGAFEPNAEVGMSMIHPDDREAAAEAVNRAIETGGAYDIEKRIVRPSGEIRYVHSVGRIISDETGHPKTLSGSFLDITERKRVEEAVEQYANELERSNRDLERFASMASHDLREPLRVVSNYLDLLASRYADRLDDRAGVYIDYAREGAAHMGAMIDALLDLSRVESQGRPLSPVDAETILDRARLALARVIQETGAEVTWDTLPTVLGDAVQLGQLFQNLIANAIKFRHRGVTPRVRISAVPLPPTPSPHGGEDRGCWRFAVQDNGIGIDPSHCERVFEVFQRLHTEQEYPGIGIGLALCRRIVERHGGCIWVESASGEGSTFYFTLPAAGARER